MILETRHLGIEFPNKSLFKDLNFQVCEDEFVVIKSGVLKGATTLLKSLAGLVERARGEVIFEGQDLLSLRGTRKILALRQKIGFVYEAGGLISLLDVFRNIALPLVYHAGLDEHEIAHRVEHVARDLEIEDILDLEPNELNDVQTRTVNLARALVTQPRLLLIDELEGGMSRDHLHKLIDIIKHYQKTCHFGVIMTTLKQKADFGTTVYRIQTRGLVAEHTG